MSKVNLDKGVETSLVPTDASVPAVEQSTQVTYAGPSGVGISTALHRVVDPCPKCGHLICMCSLLNLVNGGDTTGL